jgi:antitoxin (DNA-binding transcriptional repressor) of toxin-antitoxin stability system
MKNVNIAHLKTHLSQQLREVRAGRSLTILHRNNPIALLTPMTLSDVMITPPAEDAPPLAGVKLPPPARVRVDVVDILRGDRRKPR